MFTAISQSITTELQSGKSDKRLWKMYGSESQSELLYVCWLEGGTCKLISNHSDLFFGSGIIDLFLNFFSSMWTDYVTKWFRKYYYLQTYQPEIQTEFNRSFTYVTNQEKIWSKTCSGLFLLLLRVYVYFNE